MASNLQREKDYIQKTREEILKTVEGINKEFKMA